MSAAGAGSHDGGRRGGDGAPMTFVESTPMTALRQRLRALIKDELPEDFHSAFVPGHEGQDVANAFCRRLAQERLLTYGWPERHGGADGSIWEQTALREEFWANDEPRGAQYLGVNWVGPTIMHAGTAEQIAAHVPPIAAGETVWCQGFSEPNAGTDLASLQLRAVAQDNGDFVANGQKIWTSYAGLADWCFLAARTSTGASKHHGISIFLVPMTRDGITVRPIDSIMGSHHLNEVFFDDVVLHRDELLGELDHGWAIIDLVLRFERVGIARYARNDRLLSLLWPLVVEADGDAAAALRETHATELVQARIARLLNYRVLASGEESGEPVQPSVARISSITLDQRVAELAMETMGSDAVDPDPAQALSGRVEEHWRYARSATVASGTTEVHRLLAARYMTAGR
jgi:alkylation response protein AidB-like acyl-CoA dehydrogenase